MHPSLKKAFSDKGKPPLHVNYVYNENELAAAFKAVYDDECDAMLHLFQSRLTKTCVMCGKCTTPWVCVLCSARVQPSCHVAYHAYRCKHAASAVHVMQDEQHSSPAVVAAEPSPGTS